MIEQLPKAVFWFGLAVAYAIAEIEIEGKYGWSEKTQTWYRTYNHHRRSIFLKYVMGRKPLTGYHIPVFTIALLISHAHFLMGIQWSLVGELMALALFLAWAPLWDNLWLIFNPNYGVGKASKKTVWWYAHTAWVGGLFPMENVVQWVISIGLAVVAYTIGGEIAGLWGHLVMMGYFVVFGLAASIFLAPIYKRYYKKMRQHDDRKRAGIFH